MPDADLYQQFNRIRDHLIGFMRRYLSIRTMTVAKRRAAFNEVCIILNFDFGFLVLVKFILLYLIRVCAV